MSRTSALNSKTKRPRKTKLCTGVPQVTCDSHADFKVKSQGHGAGAYCGGHLAAQLVLVKLLCLCFSGFDNSMYVELYDGEDNIVTEMIQAGVAAKSSPSPDTVRFHQRIDDNTTSVPSLTDEPEYVLIPG